MLPHAFLPSQEPKAMTPAQRRALAVVIGDRVAASAGLPPRGKPFGDQVTPNHAPAKDKFVPDLTDRAASARALRQRTNQHGLLTPDQRAAEAKATLPAVTAPSFHSRHDLTRTPMGDLTPPPVPHMTLQEIADMLGWGRRGVAGAFPPPVPRAVAPAPPVSAAPPTPHVPLGGIPEGAQRTRLISEMPVNHTLGRLSGEAAGWLGRNVVGPASTYAGTGLTTGGRDLFEGLTGIGGPSAIDQILHQKSLQKHIKEGWTTPAALNQRIAQSELHGPDPSKILVALHDLKGAFSAATNAGVSQAADGRTASVPLSELAGATGWGLTDAARKRGVELIKKRGWSDAQIEAMGGDPTTFIQMQYSDPPSTAESVVKGLGQDVITGGSQTVGALGLLSETLQGRGPQAFANLADQLHQTIPVFGKHPYSEELAAHPLFAATAGLALLKGGGALGHVLPMAERPRIQTLHGQIDHLTGEPMQINRGHYSKNLYTGAMQKLGDLALASSTRASQGIWRNVGDLLVRQQRSRITPEHVPVQVAYRDALRKVGPERAQELMALQDHGGAPGVTDALAHFQALENAGVEVPRSRIELLNRLHEVQQNLTPEDHEFLKAHSAIAEHTSTQMQNRGAHLALTQLYRKYETVIEMGAAHEARVAEEAGVAPSGPFTEAKRARDEYLHMHESGGHPSERWIARQKELLRNIAGHAKRAATPSARKVKQFQEDRKAYLEELRPWRAKQQEIKSREPEKPPPKNTEKPAPEQTTTKVDENTRTKNFGSRKEALDAAKPVKAKHPDWQVKVARGEGATWDVTVTRPSGGTKTAKITPVEETVREYAVPPRFYEDHSVRFEGNPEAGSHSGVVRQSKTTRVHLDRAAYDNLLADAKFYSEEYGPDGGQGIRASARATVKALEKQGRPAADTAKIAETHKAWRDELKAHNATRPVAPEAPAGLSRNAGRLAVHEGEVTREGKRAQRFRDALPEKTPDETIMQDYHDAVHAAVAAHHAREGAIDPARVQRTDLPLDKKHKFPGRGRNLTTNLNVGHSQTSTGETVRSGNYIYDHASPLRENVHEQMNRMKSGLYNAVVGHPLVHDATGGGDKNARRVKADGGTDAEIEAARAPVTVPEGVVAVPVHYPGSSAQVTVPNWGSESPTLRSEVIDPNVKLSAIERLAQRRRSDGHLIAGEKIPDGARVLLIPEGLYQRLDEYAHPNGGAEPDWYDKVNRYYQKLLIGIYPSTWLGNGPGSIPLAMASGALHPRDYYRAFRSGPQGPVARALGIERTNTRHAALQNLGPGGGLGRLAGDEANLITRGIEGGRAASVAGENFAAAASWEGRARVGVDGRLPTLRRIIPGLDKLMPEHLKGKAAQMSVDAATLHTWLRENKITVKDGMTLPDEIQAMVDRGETQLIPGSMEGERTYALPPELQELTDRMASDVIDFMSEGSKPRGRFGNMVGKAVLFQNWIGHIAKLTLFTLPIKHPRRAALLNALSMYGNDYRRRHGVYPNWMSQFFPLQKLGNYERSVGVGQLTPTASALNLAQSGTNMLDRQNPSNSWLEQLNNVVSPLLQPIGDAALADLYDRGLKPSEHAKFRSPLHAFTSGAYFALPGAHKFQTLSGYNKGAAGFMGIPLPGPVFGGLKKKDYFVYLDNGDGTFQKLPIRWGDRPGGHPEAGPAGALSRYLGLPLERSAREGRQWHNTITNDRTFANVDDFKRRFPFG